jgi:hypothetical protein
MFGGLPNPTVTTSHYDGTTWSSAPNLGTGRYYASLGPIGTQSSALFASGNTGTVTPATEEFTSAPVTRTFTTS